ncbi:unnamed protein product [Ambrosiozyma monospora]|uniref:Unnamed protein product n=1 Tax=Ambrosiozyma monospora TaxID=43982 RepID=A0A9W6YUB1_AMBMO|nr:unnamed protein product [Ambrosiozyma monospora]
MQAIVIANAINNLNQVTKATENKVFKKQLQNQLKALSESLVTHVKQQVENDPLTNSAPLVKRIYDQYLMQKQQQQQQDQPKQSDQQQQQKPEIGTSSIEKL